MGGDHGRGTWFPLSGVASGQVLLSADFIDDLGRNAGDILDNLLKGLDADGNPVRKSSRDSMSDNNLSDNLPNGVATINLIKAKNLMKIDPNETTKQSSESLMVETVENSSSKCLTVRSTERP